MKTIRPIPSPMKNRTVSARPFGHYWEVYSTVSQRVIGVYTQTDFRAAMRDAAILRTSGSACDVRRAV